MAIPMQLTKQQETLTRRCQQEREGPGKEFVLPVYVDLDSAICLIANLQLALRHPGNTGASAKVARMTIDGLIERMKEAGLTAHAELARLGDDPAHDI